MQRQRRRSSTNSHNGIHYGSRFRVRKRARSQEPDSSDFEGLVGNSASSVKQEKSNGDETRSAAFEVKTMLRVSRAQRDFRYDHLLPYQRFLQAHSKWNLTPRQTEIIVKWLMDWKADARLLSDAMLWLTGPPGSGKSVCGRMALRSRGFAVVEIDSSMSLAEVARRLRFPACGLDGRRVAFLVEDADQLLENSSELRGLKTTKLTGPVIGTALYVPPTFACSPSNVVRFLAFNDSVSEQLARTVLLDAKTTVSASALASAVACSSGDARQVIFNASLLALNTRSARDSSQNPFAFVKRLLATRNTSLLCHMSAYSAAILFENTDRFCSLLHAATFVECLSFLDGVGGFCADSTMQDGEAIAWGYDVLGLQALMSFDAAQGRDALRPPRQFQQKTLQKKPRLLTSRDLFSKELRLGKTTSAAT